MTEAFVSWETRLDVLISGLEPRLVEIRRYLHAHPEPSGEEIETSKFIATTLEEAGLEPRVCRDGLGVVVDLRIGEPSASTPLVAIRVDIDGLRMLDEKAVPYKSQNVGVSHSCGHDAHTAIALGVALAGAGLRDELAGEPFDSAAFLRFLFQPAEETAEGARWLVDQDVLAGVEAIMTLHVDPERPLGQVGLRTGVVTANCDDIGILVEGHGGHAARPHHTIDPVAAAAQLVGALYQYLPRSVDSRSPSVFTVGQINGGFAPNVIPERVELRGSLRTIDARSREILKRRITEIAGGIEEVSHTRIRVQFRRPLRAVNNDRRLTAAFEEASRHVVGGMNVRMIDRPSMGSEDFSVYLEHVPGALLRLGCAAVGDDAAPGLHSAVFDIDERAISVGARILARAALRLTSDLRTDNREE